MKYLNMVVNEYRVRCTMVSADRRVVGNIIRDIADNDESFENLVFELGLRVLRKELIKQDKE